MVVVFIYYFFAGYPRHERGLKIMRKFFIQTIFCHDLFIAWSPWANVYDYTKNATEWSEARTGG